MDVDLNKIYTSKFDGDYIITDDLGYDENKHYMVKIKFLNTNNEQIVRLEQARKNSARDWQHLKEQYAIDFDKIYCGKYGRFKIIKQLESRNGNKRAQILFIDTGTIKDVNVYDIINCTIRDPYYKNICSVACLGNADSTHMLYPRWNSMISRCYNPDNNAYVNYGALGVTVCDTWLCFEYFLQEIIYVKGYDDFIKNPSMYELDKDLLQFGIPECEKVYSMTTCCFIPRIRNNSIMLQENKSKKKYTSKYFGVSSVTNGMTYNAEININNKKYYLGTYDDEIAAANAYNMAARNMRADYSLGLYNNGIPFMNPLEIMVHNTNPKELIKIVEK